MTFQEATSYLALHSTQAPARVILLPLERWTEFRSFLQSRKLSELRLSSLITEDGWLPSPEDVLGRVRGPGFLLGLDGYVALLDAPNRRLAMETVKRLVDGGGSSSVICLFRDSVENRELVASVFANPR